MKGTAMNQLENHESPARVAPTGRLRRRARCLGLLILSAALLASMAAAALAAKPIQKSYAVQVKPLALASGNTVKANVIVTAPEAKVRSWWSAKTVSAVVRKGVNGGYQSPYRAEGYRCTPVVRGEKTSFTCKLMGADVPTTVRLTFTVVYRGDTASG
jgi:hypothetical protein